MRTLAFSLVLLVAACGGNGSIALDDLNDEFLGTLCAGAVRCGNFPDLATCLESESNSSDLDGLQADVEAGVIDYDEDAAADCLDAFSALVGNCQVNFNGLQEASEACDATFVGSVASGGTCTEDEQCAGRAECETESCPDACCQGICVDIPPLAGLDESCLDNDCEVGLRCDTETRTCAQPVAVGQACASFFSCVSGAVCDLDIFTNMGTCVTEAQEGDTCNPEQFFFACARSDNFCDAADTTCKARKNVGLACGGDECVNFAECVAGTCTVRPGLGDSCTVDSELECLGDLSCVNGACALDGFEGSDYCPLDSV